MEPRINMMNNKLGAQISKRMYNVSLAVLQSPLPKATQSLVELRASQINGCGWCIDVHTKEAATAGETPLRLSLVAGWRHASVFTPAERAALALTEEGTRLADAHTGVSDETWAEVRAHYDEDQAAALVWLVGLINATTRVCVISNLEGGSYEPGMFTSMSN